MQLLGGSVIGCTRDQDGHREYRVRYKVECAVTEGPSGILDSGLLPEPGDVYEFQDDSDIWATCKQPATVTPTITDEPCTIYFADVIFSTKGDEKRCKDQQIEDPLLVPDEVSGSSVKYVEEATKDRFGEKILNSAHEMLRGPQVEFDANRHTVTISQNVPALELELWGPMIDTVNDSEVWGAPKRCVKLSSVSWVKKYWGACEVYYTRKFEFDVFIRVLDNLFCAVSVSIISGGTHFQIGDLIRVPGGTSIFPTVLIVTNINAITEAITGVEIYDPGQYRTVPANPVSPLFNDTTGIGTGSSFNLTYQGLVVSGFDKDLLDEGSKVLHGHWDDKGVWNVDPLDSGGLFLPDKTSPNDFDLFTDRNGNPAKVILNGSGLPANTQVYDPNSTTGTGATDSGEPGNVHVEKYGESDFFQLNIPLVL